MIVSPRPLLALEAALGAASAAVLEGETVLAETAMPGRHGAGDRIAPLLDAALRSAGVAPGRLTAVAVSVGPGSFTGLRGALAVAHGFSLAAGLALVPVTVAEALAETLPFLGARALWVAIDSRRGHVFLDRNGHLASVLLDDLPLPDQPIALAGDAAVAVAARLAARGANVMLTDARQPRARFVGLAAQRRLDGVRPPRAAQPLYVDPPEARLPGTRLRPAPAAP